MTLRHLLLAGCVLLSAHALGAQPTAAVSPVTGRWGENENVFLDLQSADGRVVTGVVWARKGDQRESTPITAGSFDRATGALKLEGRAWRPDGTTAPFVIEGTLRGDTLSGSYRVQADRGDFAFTRLDKPRPAPSTDARRPAKRRERAAS